MKDVCNVDTVQMPFLCISWPHINSGDMVRSAVRLFPLDIRQSNYVDSIDGRFDQ